MTEGEERASFFATAGRGTESFAENEILEKLNATHVSVRDGKVFFKLSAASGLNFPRILAVRSVERLFVAVADYDNSQYIQNKRTFLDKLMSTLSAKESFFNAINVLEQLMLQDNKDSKIENMNNVHRLHSSSAHFPNAIGTPNWHHSTVHPKQENLQGTLRNNCDCLKTENIHVPRLDLDKEPTEKCRKLDVVYSRSETVGASTLNHEQQNILDCPSDVSKDIYPDSERLAGPEKCVGHKYDHICCTSDICNGEQLICYSKCSTESDNKNNTKGCISFRMSVKCSGKVSKWMNLKKLSRDLGWRVARATGWRVELRRPNFEVCLHINDEHVTTGVPLTRFPISRRAYIMDSGLRAPVAWIMSQLSYIKPGDIVLDPMCGKATILIEASSDTRDAWFMGSDSNSLQIDKARQNLNTCGHNDTTLLLKADGLNMPYRDGCLDVVVCDAPFNQKHLFALTPQTFYYKFLREIYRVLQLQGVCVLLISEELKQMVLLMVQGTEKIQKEKQNIMTDGSSLSKVSDNERTLEECHETTDSIVPLTFMSSHYVKLGETHACILVLNK